jgi:hypothetical protein
VHRSRSSRSSRRSRHSRSSRSSRISHRDPGNSDEDDDEEGYEYDIEYDIEYDDGETEYNVPASFLRRVGERVGERGQRKGDLERGKRGAGSIVDGEGGRSGGRGEEEEVEGGSRDAEWTGFWHCTDRHPRRKSKSRTTNAAKSNSPCSLSERRSLPSAASSPARSTADGLSAVVRVAEELQQAASEFCLTTRSDGSGGALQSVRVRITDINAVIAYANVLRSVSTPIQMPSQSLVWRWCMKHSSGATKTRKNTKNSIGEGSDEDLSLSQLRDLCEDLVPDARLHFVESEEVRPKSHRADGDEVATAASIRDVAASDAAGDGAAGTQLEPQPTPQAPRARHVELDTKLHQAALETASLETGTSTSDELLANISSPHIEVGTKVEARYGGDEDWHPGEIDKANLDGTYAIAYADGDTEDNVTRALIRVTVGGDGVGGVLKEAANEVRKGEDSAGGLLKKAATQLTRDEQSKAATDEDGGSDYENDYEKDGDDDDDGGYSDSGFE